ncbi:MAG: hypothetical protein K0R71_1675 [Bacillales bacterium]|jgi:hypothetical protein|nr:hypothetical protein [Bacillales bacterium]
MVDKDNWRLQNQEEYLIGKKLSFKKFTPTINSDHEHCEFCTKKIMEKDNPDVDKDGYTTEDEYYWVCKVCFIDFKDLFKWKV